MNWLEILLEDPNLPKEQRAQFIEKVLGQKWAKAPVPGFQNFKDLIAQAAEADPTKTGIYMQWIVARVMGDPHVNKVKDFPMLKACLGQFDLIKAKLPVKDINMFKSFNDLHSALEPFLGKVTGNFKALDEVIKRAVLADPTKDGIYLKWIVEKIVSDPNTNKVEDLPRLKSDLTHFDSLKLKLTNPDINKYKSFLDVYKAIEPHIKKQLAAEKAETQARADVIDVYTGPEGWVKIPTTKDASNYLGKLTRWCTASTKSDNYFDHYNKTDKLFVIFDKAKKARFQLHLNSNSFMDEQDSPTSDFPKWALKPIVDWYKANQKNLSLTQLMNLNKFGGDIDSMVVGSGHEDLFDLMKQYGV